MKELLFIPGSLRKASSSRAMMHAVMEKLEGSVAMVVADPGALPLYNADVTDDPNVATFVRQVDEADGVVFVTPEYNYSIPGLLKNAIDWASRPAYASAFLGKPCAIITTSGGALGGVRAQAHLKYVLNGMLARVHPMKEIVVAMANTKVKDGRFEDETILSFAEDSLKSFADSLSDV